jgi:hypothetical protein
MPYRHLPQVAALIVLQLALTACATHSIPTTAEPATAAAAIAATAPDRPLHVVFDWQAMEGEARFTGQGVARIQPPYRARLDLFGPRGDTYLSAALVDDQIRMPAGAAGVQVPPPALMWAVLGVVAPPEHAVLVGTREGQGRSELYYETDGGILRYVLEEGRLRSAQWDGSGGRLAVDLRGQAPFRLPTRTVYRDAAAATELMLNLESVDEVEPHPPEIWTPGG